MVKTFERNLDIGGGNDQVYRVTQKIGNGNVRKLCARAIGPNSMPALLRLLKVNRLNLFYK